MRCYCCNTRLTPKEACTKFKNSGLPTETCNKCLSTMDVEVIVPKREFEDDVDDLIDED